MDQKKELQFVRSTAEDIDAIFSLYDDAITFQKKVFKKHWKGFDRKLIENEVAEGRQWKIIKEGEIACIFAVEFSDPLIWKEKDKDPSIYLHRIVSHSRFRGSNFILDIIEWAKVACKADSRQFIRMDTWGDNPKLISYYVNSGFSHVGFSTPEVSPSLPKHYEGIDLALFELAVS
ncbi:MAG TPA: GNAT family N-acetyltransferase [Pedobacter sp.]